MKRLLIALCIALVAVSVCTASEPRIESRTLVFVPGEYGSAFYRIPAIVCAADGTLIAVADKRIDNINDLPNRIDIVCRTSTDNGATWSDYSTVVAHDDFGGYGDPSLVIDDRSGDVLCIATHGPGLWTARGDGDYARIVVMRSSDNGRSWSEPLDITDQIFSNEGASGTAQGITAFATSGRSLSTREGRLMFTLIARTIPNPDGYTPLYAYVIYSDDGGRSWQAVSRPADTDADEAKLVELPDGRLLMSVRNRHQGGRRFTLSDDCGLSWSPIVINETLIEPACNGDIIAAVIEGKEVLLHTVPANPRERRDVTLFRSNDSGDTWHPVLTICPGPSAYSSITLLSDGTLACLTEEGSHEAGFQIWLSKVVLD